MTRADRPQDEKLREDARGAHPRPADGAEPARRVARAAAACLALGGVAACAASPGESTAPPAGRAVAVVRHEAYAQCPLQLQHPSVHWVASRTEWSRLLTGARSLPPPYDARDTDFARHAIVLVAMPTTPTPSSVALEGPEPVRWHAAEQRLDVTVRASVRDPAGSDIQRAAVVATPCVIVWVQAQADVKQVVARTADGQVIARLPR